MVLGQTNVSTAEQNAFNADAPLMIMKNALSEAVTAVIDDTPRWTTTGTPSDADISDPDAPPERAFNGQPTLPTFATDQTSGTYYWSTELKSDQTIDAVVFKPGRRTTYGTVTIDVADNSLTWTNIATFGPLTSTDIRQVEYDINGAQERYTGVTYVRIGFTVGGTFSTLPELGELILGQRRQMSRKFDRPAETQGFTNSFAEFEARSRATTRHVFFKGARDYRGSWTPSGNDLFGLDDITTIRDGWEEADFGTKLITYCEDPSTSPGETRLGLMMMEGLDAPEIRTNQIKWDFRFKEVPQFKTAET